MANQLVNELVLKDKNFGSGILAAKRLMLGYGDQAKRTKEALGKLDSVIGTNISSLTKLGAAVGAAKLAFDVLKGAFSRNEELADLWGRTMGGAKQMYNTFLDTLNNGDWSNFFGKLSKANTEGQKLYDLFDKLGSIKLNNAVPIAILELKLQELRLLKLQGKDVEDLIKQVSTKLEGLKNESVVAGKKANKEGWIGVLTGAGVNEKVASAAFKQMTISGQKFYNWAGREEAKLKAKGKGTYNDYVKSGVTNTSYEDWVDISKLNSVEKERYKLVRAVVDLESLLQQYLTGYAEATKDAASNMQDLYKWNRVANSGSTTKATGTTKSGTLAPVAMGTFEAPKPNTLPEVTFNATVLWDGNFLRQLEWAEAESKRVFNSTLAEGYNSTLSNVADSWNLVGNVVAQAGQSMAQFGIEGLDIAGIIAQAIATVALAYAQTLAKDESSKSNVWSFIAAAAAATISMATTIAAIKSNTKGYANGGIIGGNSYHGDNLIARVNSGEMVINSRQLSNLWKAINNPTNAVGSTTGGNVEFKIKGTDLVGTLNNYNKKLRRV